VKTGHGSTEARLRGWRLQIAAYVKGRLADEIKRLHNPTRKDPATVPGLAAVELIDAWHWNNMESESARTRSTRT